MPNEVGSVAFRGFSGFLYLITRLTIVIFHDIRESSENASVNIGEFRWTIYLTVMTSDLLRIVFFASH